MAAGSCLSLVADEDSVSDGIEEDWTNGETTAVPENKGNVDLFWYRETTQGGYTFPSNVPSLICLFMTDC